MVAQGFFLVFFCALVEGNHPAATILLQARRGILLRRHAGLSPLVLVFHDLVPIGWPHRAQQRALVAAQQENAGLDRQRRQER